MQLHLSEVHHNVIFAQSQRDIGQTSRVWHIQTTRKCAPVLKEQIILKISISTRVLVLWTRPCIWCGPENRIRKGADVLCGTVWSGRLGEFQAEPVHVSHDTRVQELYHAVPHPSRQLHVQSACRIVGRGILYACIFDRFVYSTDKPLPVYAGAFVIHLDGKILCGGCFSGPRGFALCELCLALVQSPKHLLDRAHDIFGILFHRTVCCDVLIAFIQSSLEVYALKLCHCLFSCIFPSLFVFQ
jgi:hypothetical protein